MNMFNLGNLQEETKQKIEEALKPRLQHLEGVKSKKHAAVLAEYTYTIFTATVMELIIAGEIEWQEELVGVPEPTWIN